MPTAVELVANLGAVIVTLPTYTAPDDWEFSAAPASALGGRSSAVQQQVLLSRPDNATGMSTGKRQHIEIESQLRPMISQIGAALAKALPANEKMVELLGVGTHFQVLSVLMDLLRTQGFHATVAFCDGSVRFGFSGPTAVVRGPGGVVPRVFLQKLSAAKGSGGTFGDSWIGQ